MLYRITIFSKYCDISIYLYVLHITSAHNNHLYRKVTTSFFFNEDQVMFQVQWSHFDSGKWLFDTVMQWEEAPLKLLPSIDFP